MKTTMYFYRLPFILAVVLGAIILEGCDSPTTKSDVQDDLKDAQEATQEAQEETQEARAAQEQFYADAHKTQIKELEDRSNKIDQRIAELKQISEKSSNQAAQVDIASAVQELQDEKETLNEKIVKVTSIKEEDWNASYDEISAAIGKIEGEIDNLSQSLETNN